MPAHKRSPKVLCFGEVLWDCLPNGRYLGGAPLNVAYHLTRLGCRAWPVSSVGDDSDGRELRDCVADLDIPGELIGIRPDRQTGLVTVSLDNGSPTYHIAEDVAWDYIDVPGRLPDNCRPVGAVVYGSLAQRSVFNQDSLRRLRDAVPDALKVFDANLRPPFDSADRIRELARGADLIKMNDDEVALILGQDPPAGDIEASARALRDQVGCDRICITAGSAGAGLLIEDKWYQVAAEAVEVRDTVGAGDAFLAALVQGFLVSPESPETVLRKAAVLAAFVAGCDGATPQYEIDDPFWPDVR